MMEKTLFIAKNSTDYKTKQNIKKIEKKTPAAANMTQINKLNYKNIYLQSITNLLFKNRWRTSRSSPCTNNLSKFIPATITTTTHTNSKHRSIGIINRMRHKISFNLTKQHLWLMLLWLLVALTHHVQSLDMTAGKYGTRGTETSTTVLYSQLLSTNGVISMHDNKKNVNNDDTFRPFVPKDPEQISRYVFAPSGQLRVFQPIDTDLRVAVSAQHKSQHYGTNNTSKALNTSLPQTYGTQQITRNQKKSKKNVKIHEVIVHQKNFNNVPHTKHQHDLEQHNKVRKEERTTKRKHQQDHKLHMTVQHEINKQNELASDIGSLNDLLVDYVTNFFEKGEYEPMPGLLVELQNNHNPSLVNSSNYKTRTARHSGATDAKVRIDLPRTLQTGRLLFLTGLKKVLWPVFMGLQVLKSLLIAMFIPAIIGSFTRLLGKGITTGSAPLFIRPIDPPQELDFRDNSLAFEEDNKFLITDEGIKENGPYMYHQPDPSNMHNEYVFDPSSASNQATYNRLGMNERQHQLMQDSYMSALQSIGSASFKNSGSLSSGSSGLLAPMAKRPPPAANVNTFQQFQNVPESSLLLSNYDPFYSPLLSRLDSVFAQLKINSDKEICREKLICLMYANPAKYAPYSNLVSAQLSRELNELRKPTSDNPDILRFFKYMRAAKDGQDGVDCEKTFDACTEFKDFDNPAMVSTYHDINKLVQARKFTSK